MAGYALLIENILEIESSIADALEYTDELSDIILWLSFWLLESDGLVD